MTANLPEWLAEGVKVRSWTGLASGYPGLERTVTKVTPTQITLDDGTKWRVKDLTQIVARTRGSAYRMAVQHLHPVTDPQMARKLADDERDGTARHLSHLLLKWTNSPDEPMWSDGVRSAIERLAPHLGLTVTRD